MYNNQYLFGIETFCEKLVWLVLVVSSYVVPSMLGYWLVDDRCTEDISSVMRFSCINGAFGAGINTHTLALGAMIRVGG